MINLRKKIRVSDVKGETSLIKLSSKLSTDKGNLHSYLPVYHELFNEKKDKISNLMEIGIASGGSIKLWREYFSKASIYAIDLLPCEEVSKIFNGDTRVFLRTSTDAYDANIVRSIKDKFDIIIDDGPHSLDSMIFFVKNYLRLLNKQGVLIIEDLQDINWVKEISIFIPFDMQKYIKIYDLRNIKNRYDDILFTVNLSLKS